MHLVFGKVLLERIPADDIGNTREKDRALRRRIRPVSRLKRLDRLLPLLTRRLLRRNKRCGKRRQGERRERDG